MNYRRISNGEPPCSSCLPYCERCAIHDTTQMMAGEGQDDQTKDDRKSLLPPYQSMRAGEISASAVDAAAAAREKEMLTARRSQQKCLLGCLSLYLFLPAPLTGDATLMYAGDLAMTSAGGQSSEFRSLETDIAHWMS